MMITGVVVMVFVVLPQVRLGSDVEANECRRNDQEEDRQRAENQFAGRHASVIAKDLAAATRLDGSMVVVLPSEKGSVLC